MKYEKGIIQLIIRNNGYASVITSREKEDLKHLLHNHKVNKLATGFVESMTEFFVNQLRNTKYEVFKIDLVALTFLNVIIVNEETKRAFKIQYCRNNSYKGYQPTDSFYSLLYYNTYLLSFSTIEEMVIENC